MTTTPEQISALVNEARQHANLTTATTIAQNINASLLHCILPNATISDTVVAITIFSTTFIQSVLDEQHQPLTNSQNPESTK